MKLLPSLQLMN